MLLNAVHVKMRLVSTRVDDDDILNERISILFLIFGFDLALRSKLSVDGRSNISKREREKGPNNCRLENTSQRKCPDHGHIDSRNYEERPVLFLFVKN